MAKPLPASGKKAPPKERKNKSQEKRRMLALRALGERLVALGNSELEVMPLPQPLRDAVDAARKYKRTALQRQYKYIEGLMRDVDVDAIRQALDKQARPHREAVQVFHEVEQWRDRLLAGDDALLDDLPIRFEHADRQRLRQLVRNARKERETDKPPKSARLLFAYLSELQQTADSDGV